MPLLQRTDLAGRHFLSTLDFTPEEVRELVRRARYNAAGQVELFTTSGE